MKPLVALCLFCSGVRKEVGGTDTIVGVYKDSVTVPAFPGMFPSLTIYTKIAFPLEHSPGNVSLAIVNPDESVMQRIDMPSEVLLQAYSEARRLGSPNAGVVFEMDIAPFTVNVAGRYLVNLIADDDQTTIGHLNFLLKANSAPAPVSL
jgi:hypothetical protein